MGGIRNVHILTISSQTVPVRLELSSQCGQQLIGDSQSRRSGFEIRDTSGVTN